MKRRFTKYPSNYVRASEEISVGQLERLIETYKGTDLGYRAIISELQDTYGVDIAKEVADAVAYDRRQQDSEEERWHRWCDSHTYRD